MISRNAGLELFVDVFNRVAQLYSPDWQRLGSAVGKETSHAHAMIAEAIMAGDAGLARNRMRKHLQAEADFFRRRRSTRQLLPDSVVLAQSAQGKGAEAVARNITQTIVTEGLQPGELVGTEPELIEREGVSRALLREAVRLLEHHQIARMRRGPGGGLFVMAPSANAVTEVAAIYLARQGMKLAELAEMRTGVEVAIADLAADRIDEEGADRAARGAERGRSTPPMPSGSKPCTTCTRRWPRRPRTVCCSWLRWCSSGSAVCTRSSAWRRRPGSRSRPKCCAPMRASPALSSRAIANWPVTACAGISRRLAPSCADQRR